MPLSRSAANADSALLLSVLLKRSVSVHLLPAATSAAPWQAYPANLSVVLLIGESDLSPQIHSVIPVVPSTAHTELWQFHSCSVPYEALPVSEGVLPFGQQALHCSSFLPSPLSPSFALPFLPYPVLQGNQIRVPYEGAKWNHIQDRGFPLPAVLP